MSFLNLRTTCKGAIGERIIERLIQANGWRYEAAPDAPHQVDFFVTIDGERIAVEVKTYARRYAKADTGIDAADYRTYSRMNVRVLLIFVDSFEQCIYQQWVHRLHVTSTAHGKVYFALHQFSVLRALTTSELSELNRYKLSAKYALTRRHFGAEQQSATR